MSEIRALPEEVINQIAAGEVVERPAHLVKELIENSLDAGAKTITVDVFNGGRGVRVLDDGRGIPTAELPLALKRFTTSKIQQAEDLWALSSFGFRGEALASIAAVSKLRLQSRTEKNSEASLLESEFGTASKPVLVAGPVGTEITVSELFENVPARLKFLKSSSSEVGAIKNVIKAMALAHHQVTFRLRNESELLSFYPTVPNKRQRVEQILETPGLIYNERTEYGVTLQAVFANPNVTQKTSKGLWFFAQGRWIQDRTLQAAVIEAYRTTLMHGEYPLAVVWVEVPSDEIDVNIHPTKSQVKFLNQSKIFRLVGQTIRPELEKFQMAKSFSPPVATPMTFESLEVSRTQYQTKNFQPVQSSLAQTSNFSESKEIDSLEPQSGSQPHGLMTAVNPSSDREPKIKGPWGQLQIIGQSHLTYLITQSRDQLVIVDQHAAHERVLFETIMQGWRDGNIDRQSLLFPLTVDLGSDKVEALMSVKADFERLGLAIETMGPATLGVSSTPSFLKESALPQILDQVAVEILDLGGSFSFEKKVIDLAATMACHSAIRAGQSLSLPEMQSLLESMDQFSFSSFCPHGRPVSINKSLVDIEKDFGRRNA